MARQSEGAWYRGAKDCWYATVGGRQVSLGVRGKKNRKAARDAWHRILANGPVPVVRLAREAASPGVRELVTAFLTDIGDRAKPKTVAVYRYFLDGFVARFGDRRADAITPHEAEAFARKPSWSASTRHDFLGTLVTAFRWATRAKLLPANPLVDVRKPPKTSRGVKTMLTADQYSRLSAAASPAFRLFLTGLWLTGCRPGELARLEGKDVDFKAGVVLLADHKTAEKTGRPRVIYLSPEAFALFRTQAETHPAGPLFRNSLGGQWTGWAVVKAMDAARKKAGLSDAIAYGLRHSFATDALASGVPDATVAALLGHTNTAMLHKHYAHLTAKAGILRNAAALVRPGPASDPAGEPPKTRPA